MNEFYNLWAPIICIAVTIRAALCITHANIQMFKMYSSCRQVTVESIIFGIVHQARRIPAQCPTKVLNSDQAPDGIL